MTWKGLGKASLKPTIRASQSFSAQAFHSGIWKITRKRWMLQPWSSSQDSSRSAVFFCRRRLTFSGGSRVWDKTSPQPTNITDSAYKSLLQSQLHCHCLYLPIPIPTHTTHTHTVSESVNEECTSAPVLEWREISPAPLTLMLFQYH